MALLALLSIVLVPAVLKGLERLADRPLEMEPIAVAKAVFTTALAPLGAGMLVRALLPRAARLQVLVNRVAWALLLSGIGVLLASSLPALWALVGNGMLVAMTTFILVAFDNRSRVGRAGPGTFQRPGVVERVPPSEHRDRDCVGKLPDGQFGATILLYVIMNATLCIPYVVWQRRLRPHRAIENHR